MNLNLQLAAELTSPLGVTGYAKFEFKAEENDTAEVELEIEIENAPAGAVLEVRIDDTLIGSMTVDDQGEGKLKFKSDADEEGELPFPDGLNLLAGSTILIGADISGTFAAPL